MYITDGLKNNSPLVVVLHGYGGNNNPKNFDIDEVADKNGFAVCYPLGLKDPKGNNGFNVGYPSQDGMNVDDVDDLSKLTKYIQKKYSSSKENTFCTGMSNGGDMCYLLGISKQNPFSAFASVAGLNFLWSYEKYDALRPLPFMEIHGTNDKVSEWNGDLENKGGWGKYISVPIAISYWVSKNKCTEMITDILPLKNPDKSCKVKRHRYTGGINGNEVWLYEIEDGTHSWANNDINTGEEIWSFFEKFIK